MKSSPLRMAPVEVKHRAVFVLAVSLALFGCTPAIDGIDGQAASSAPASAQQSSKPSQPSSQTAKFSVAVEEQVVAESVATLAVPFAPQAPFANWDPLHEEACEEMSLIMVKYFLLGQSLSLQKAEDDVQELVGWMTEQGYGYDVTVEQLATTAREHYGFGARVLTNVNVETIVEELRAGRPVIVPVAGRDIGNPFFSGEGPWYHMLVITGYKKSAFGDIFITNDPGTKRGEAYEYKTSVLLDAIHDWTGVKEEIRNGPKRALVIEQ